MQFFWYQKQLKIKLKVSLQMSKLGHFSAIPVFLLIACVGLLACMGGQW